MNDGELGWPIWIGVVTEGLEATRDFYRDTLGLAELESGPERAKLDGGSGRMIEVVQATSDPESGAPGYQLGFEVDDVEAVRRRLVDAGVDALTEVQGGERSGSYWCYFRDPDGNVFQVTQEIHGGDD